MERAPGQRADKVENRIGMRCREQLKTSLRGLQGSSHCRAPQVDRQMRTDLIDYQSGFMRINRLVGQKCEGLEAASGVNTTRAPGEKLE
jgi:hypothetical protein